VWADGGIVMVTVAVAILVVVAERGLAVVVHDGETGSEKKDAVQKVVCVCWL